MCFLANITNRIPFVDSDIICKLVDGFLFPNFSFIVRLDLLDK